MQLSWRGTNILLLSTTTVMFASEGHLIAFTPLQLRELGLNDDEVGVWTGILVAITMGMALPLGPFWGVLAERFSRRAILLRTFVVLAISLLVAHLARVVPHSYQTGVFGLFPTVGNVGGPLFPLLAAGVVSSGLWAAFAIGALGYAASVISGVKLGRVPVATPARDLAASAEAG